MLTQNQGHLCSINVGAHLCQCSRMKHWTVEYILHVLEQRDWSANRLAQEAGVAVSTIGRPLREQDYKYALSPATVAKVHKASGIDPKPYMPKEMSEPNEMYRAGTGSTAARALKRLMEKETDQIARESINHIQIAVCGSIAQIVATIDREGIEKLRKKLDAIEAMLDP